MLAPPPTPERGPQQSSARRADRAHSRAAIDHALEHLARTQDAGGSWKGDYGGPLFLLPMYVSVCWAAQIEIDEATRSEMERYLRGHQNPDGGWGLHVEGHSHVFTTMLNYVALRVMGVAATDAALTKARTWLHAHGGPTASASWGKFVLYLLNLYERDGLNPVPPELWLLPTSLPVHPSRLWCHCRMVYLPMSYLYGSGWQAPLTPLTRALRDEIYPAGYENVGWRAARDRVAASDSYVPHSPIVRAANELLTQYERRPSRLLRRRALAFVRDQIRQEDENTNHICIGPISKLFHTLIAHIDDPTGPTAKAHRAQLPDYLWHAPDGVKMQGYNGSELWDTAFAVQAIGAALEASAEDAGRNERNQQMLRAAHKYIEANQVLEDTPNCERYFRHRSKGGWPFSTREHGWPISDCTSEGMKATFVLQDIADLSTPDVPPITRTRLRHAAELLLSWQNADGGWATYELTRGPRWLEQLNPSDCFSDIMIDYPYVECTSACIQALQGFAKREPHALTNEIKQAVAAGQRFILGIQRDDGSWEGSWGVCFTYGTWFGVTGLLASGLPRQHVTIQRACRFLLAHQHSDGSWGETVENCRERRYLRPAKGQAVMTAWALLTLAAGAEENDSDAKEAIARGRAYLLEGQQLDGSWPEEHIAGVFNKTCAIQYDNYLKIFPIWALAATQA